MSQHRSSLVPTVLAGVLASLLVTVVLAPVLTHGWCYDAVEGGESSCGSVQTSLLGIESNIWLWIGAMVLVIAVTLIPLRRRSRTREDA